MGCGCGNKGKLPTTRRKEIAEPIEVPTEPRVFLNVTDEILRSRNPRFEVRPGDTILLDVAVINHSARNWIRRGELVDVELVPA